MTDEQRFVNVGHLSTWLAAYASPPLYAMAEVMEHEDLTVELNATLQANRKAKAWQYHIERLIDCGLLQGVTVVVNDVKDCYGKGKTECIELSEGKS